MKNKARKNQIIKVLKQELDFYKRQSIDISQGYSYEKHNIITISNSVLVPKDYVDMGFRDSYMFENILKELSKQLKDYTKVKIDEEPEYNCCRVDVQLKVINPKNIY